MKLTEDKINVETNGLISESMFGVANLGMIFDILRNKLYSNPIGSACREYAVNARDAHVETGRQHIPVRIVLPSTLDPHWRVIDQGPGITPDRMNNVCIQYAASTKRDSNDQVGGFGIGMKSGWAYSDSFNITTVVDGIRYAYCCFIDETKIGKLALLSQTSTDEVNGTQISIPVRPENFREFAKATEEATRWWESPVEISGDYNSLRLDKKDILMSGQDWDVYTNSRYNNENAICILIDGIMYAMDRSMVDGYRYNSKQDKMAVIFNGSKSFVVRFGNGVLSLGANREAIQWDERTKKILAERLSKIADEITANLQTEISGAGNYIEACEMLNRFNRAFNCDLATTLKWGGIEIKTSFRKLSGNMYSDKWYCFSLPRGRANVGNNVPSCDDTLTKEKDNYYEVSNNTLLVINDIELGNLSKKRAAQILDTVANTSITSLQVIPESSWKTMVAYHQHLPHFILSSLLGKKTAAGDLKVRKARRLVYRFGFGKFTLSSFETFEKDLGKKVYCMLKRDYTGTLIGGISYDILYSLQKKHSVTVYGFEEAMFSSDPDSFSDFTDDATAINSFIKNTVLAGLSLAELYQHSDIDDYSNSILAYDTIKKIAPKVENQVMFSQYLELVKQTKENEKVFRLYHDTILEIHPEFKQMDKHGMNKINAVFSKIETTYPLCSILFERSHHMSDKMIDGFVEYIGLVDRSSDTRPNKSNDEYTNNGSL